VKKLVNIQAKNNQGIGLDIVVSERIALDMIKNIFLVNCNNSVRRFLFCAAYSPFKHPDQWGALTSALAKKETHNISEILLKHTEHSQAHLIAKLTYIKEERRYSAPSQEELQVYFSDFECNLVPILTKKYKALIDELKLTQIVFPL
jgi:hypothetical protein